MGYRKYVWLKGTSIIQVQCISLLALITFKLLLDDLNEIYGGTEGSNDVCDFTACNGLLYEVEIDGKVEVFGQCQANLDNEPFCFVNEASICKKEKSKTKPGKFISLEPCQDPRAPPVTTNKSWFDLGGVFGKLLPQILQLLPALLGLGR